MASVARHGEARAGRVVMCGNAQRQRPTGGEAAGTHVACAVDAQHEAVAFEGYVVGVGYTVLGAERVVGKPHVAAGAVGELDQHVHVALVGAYEHASAIEVENRALGRGLAQLYHQASAAQDIALAVDGLGVSRHVEAAVAVHLANLGQELVLGQRVLLLDARCPDCKVECLRSKAHCGSLCPSIETH